MNILTDERTRRMVKNWLYTQRGEIKYKVGNAAHRMFPTWVCPQCHRVARSVERRRQNTMYHNDEDNHITCCFICFKANEEYWDEQWDEYYSGTRGGLY